MLFMELSNPANDQIAEIGPSGFIGLQCDRRPLRLMIVDDHLLYRESLARLLTSEGNFELLAQCSDVQDTLNLLKKSHPDVVLVDIAMSEELIPNARTTGDHKFLVLAREVGPTTCAAVLKSGASGIFLASDSPGRLIQAIRLVASGDAWVEQKMVQMLAENYANVEFRWSRELTQRETSVLRGVVDGLSNRKIADQLGASESTIKATLQQLFKKAGVRTRSQLVRIALETSPVSDATGVA